MVTSTRLVITTVNYDGDPRWMGRTEILQAPCTLRDEIRLLFQILRRAFHKEAMILDSSCGRLHPDIVAAVILGWLPKRLRPVLVMMGCMWNRDRGRRGIIQALVMKLADRSIDLYVVQSTEELTAFPKVWGLKQGKTRFAPYFYTFVESELYPARDLPEGYYIFSGGNSQRNYEPLIAAAERLPHLKFIIATKTLKDRPNLPANVIAKPLPHKEYVRQMQGAAAVVVPVNQDMTRAAGQQTYLNAMYLGKPTIVPDAFAVHDHLVDKQNGLIVDGSAESYVQALTWVTDPAHQDEVKAIARRGQDDAHQKFTFENHVMCVLVALDEAIALRGKG